VVSSLAYPNLLKTKRLGCCCIRETVEAITTDGAPVVTENENKLDGVPQSEVEKDKEGEPNEEEEDKV
jgi:hypothetical protein